MDKEEDFWKNLEKIYVHNVYESISYKYDEFLKLDQIQNNNHYSKSGQEDGKLKTNLPHIQNDISNVTTNNLIASSNEFLIENNQASTSNKLKCAKNGSNFKTLRKYKAWPKVDQFLQKLEPNSFVADIGCGEGKYLNLNNRVFMLGCDRCSSLCEIGADKKSHPDSIINQNQILVCDNLSLPFRYYNY